MGLINLIKRAELPYVNRWINDDIRPIETARRTWGYFEFHNYWLLINCNIACYMTGSALIPFGLNWYQAFISIILGNLIATVAVILNSLPGTYYHIGFPVFSRVVWGMWGAQFAIWNRIFLSLVWYGFTAWIGGQCFYVIMLSWNPNLEAAIPNTMPADTGMTTAQFVAYIVFSVISLPLLWIRPHRLQVFFYVSCSITFVFFVVILIWALATMGSAGFGDTLSSATTIPTTGGPYSVAWLMIYGVVSTVGSIAAGILNQNDYTRFSKKPRHAIVGQAVAFPVYAIFGSLAGILVTAATQKRFGGEAVWSPPDLLARLILQYNDAGTRAACFFGGLALVVAQLGVNVSGNALAGGFDLAATFPKFINIRRGAYITAILSPIVNPWRLVNTATIFLTVLSSYSVFLAPMTGLMVSSYFLVNRKKLSIDDMYRGGKSSIYWYTLGVNWRAPVAWLIGVVPCMPGFVAAVNTNVTVSDGATELYYMSYLYGFLAGGGVYAALHWVFPAPAVARFVRDSPAARELREKTYDQWDVTLAETSQILEAAKGRGGKNSPRQVAESPEVKAYGDGLDAGHTAPSQPARNF